MKERTSCSTLAEGKLYGKVWRDKPGGRLEGMGKSNTQAIFFVGNRSNEKWKKIHVIGTLFESTLDEGIKIDLVRLFKFHSAGKYFILIQRENLEIVKLPMGRKSKLSHFISFHLILSHPIFGAPSTDLIPGTHENLLAEFLILEKTHYWALSMAVIPNLQNIASTTTITS